MKTRNLLLFLLCIVGIVCCQAKGPSKIYVSSTTGSDKNSGKSQEAPLKTIACAITKGNDIYLKCGDIFYENIQLRGKRLSSYGTGANPILSGYKRIAKPKWKKAGKNIWKIRLSDNLFTGFDTKGSSLLNNVGCIHEYDKDLVHGRKVERKNELKSNWDFWQTSDYDSRSVNAHSFDELYLYSKTNPNQLKLEFSVGVIGAILSDATMENIKIQGFGCHGIVSQSNTTIRNCRIDAVGGMTYIGTNKFVCYGNGIEYWVDVHPVENCLMERCHISRTYDAGMTIQGSATSKLTPKNILIQNNLITECCQGWEDFLNNGKQYVNCRLKNNVFANCGNTTGFGYPESRFVFCNVLGHNHDVRNGMIIEGNTFIGGNFYSASPSHGDYQSNIWKDNVFYTTRGHWILSYYTGKSNVIRLPEGKSNKKDLDSSTEKMIRQYRQMTGDKTTRFEIKSEEEIQSLIKSHVSAFGQSQWPIEY